MSPLAATLSPATPRPLSAVARAAVHADVTPVSGPMGLGAVVLSADVVREVITPQETDLRVWGQTAHLRTLELLAQLQRARRRGGLALVVAFDVTLRRGGLPTAFALAAEVRASGVFVRIA